MKMVAIAAREAMTMRDCFTVAHVEQGWTGMHEVLEASLGVAVTA